MNITVFGANGRVGQKVVLEFLGRGHHVTAFVHGESKLLPSQHLVVIQGDVKLAGDAEIALQNAEVVISTLGSWGTKTKDILSAGMKVIIPSMQKLKIKRIITVTGGDARDVIDKPNILNVLSHFLLKIVVPKILADGEAHIKLLRNSELDWTVLRSPVMKETGKRGFKLTTKAPTPWATINRNDVVEAIVRLVESSEYIKSSPYISRKIL